jgi:hypothetical protein
MDESKQALMGKGGSRREGYVANPVPAVICNAAIAIVHIIGFLVFMGCLVAGSVMATHSTGCKGGVHTNAIWRCGDPFPEIMGPRFFGLAVLLVALPLARYCWAIKKAWIHYESDKRPYDPWRVINEYYCSTWNIPEYEIEESDA